MFQPPQNRRAYEELRSLPPLSELQFIISRYDDMMIACSTGCGLCLGVHNLLKSKSEIVRFFPLTSAAIATLTAVCGESTGGSSSTVTKRSPLLSLPSAWLQP